MISYPNSYKYKDVVYKTTDAFFTTHFDVKPILKVGDDVSAASWVNFQTVNLNQIAFDSVRHAIDHFLISKRSERQ